MLASRKLWHYFEAHRITVVTEYPLERVFHNRGATGRIAEWAMELSGFDLHFTRTKVINSKIVGDFLSKWRQTALSEEEPEETSIPWKEVPNLWVMYFDGAFCCGGAGAGVLLHSPMGEDLKY